MKRHHAGILAVVVAVVAVAIVAIASSGGGLHGIRARIHKLERRAVSHCPVAKAGKREAKVRRSNVTVDEHGHVHALRAGKPMVSHATGACTLRGRLSKALGARGPPPLEFADVARGQRGFDLSNNDPAFDFGPFRRAGLTYAWLKDIEGRSFHDQTAKRMRIAGDGAGVLTGGYDFGHICLVSASEEAHLFAVELRADGFDPDHGLKPVLDAEYGSCPSHSAGQAWVRTWIAQMRTEGWSQVGIYAGCFWWTPNTGGFWPSPTVFNWTPGYPSLPVCANQPAAVHQDTDKYRVPGINFAFDGNVLLRDPSDVLATPQLPVEVRKLKDQIVYFWNLREHQRLSPGEKKTLDADMNRIYYLGWQPHRSQPTQDWGFGPGLAELKKCRIVRAKWRQGKHGTYVRRLIDELWEFPLGSGGPHVRVHTYRDRPLLEGCVRMPGWYKVHG